ncbi:auxilin-like protein [Trifolium medium]|uniref:Auxilin-like protein n=1 Tax=Trifolium medium TaxID=97028 RepID=A0A392PTT0_9FABA|nr:auxilin-like protein [Trifolium medium]
MDVMVYEWIWGKHACVDLIWVSPPVGLRTDTFTVGGEALKDASSGKT